MKSLRQKVFHLILTAGIMSLWTGCSFAQSRVPDVHYEPTPQLIVEEMLKMAEVNRNDIVYDLGCGDGRFVITAAKKYGARGVGIDIDPERIKESRQNARIAGVQDRVRFIEADLFETDFREATVVALYLLPELNLQLRPKILEELRPGTRVVSHEFDMYDWPPDKMGSLGRNKYYLWVVPVDAGGQWRWTFPSPRGEELFTFRITQTFQNIDGRIATPFHTVGPLEAYLIGDQIGFLLRYRPPGQKVEMRFQGRVSGNTINGTVEVHNGPLAGKHKWVARRHSIEKRENDWKKATFQGPKPKAYE
ncbi:MAG: class I SAM-dependent methyltransferase [Syntrophaceae bacterium]|nr:class I SAM-dependent methyltransferase [Syntrophaceae bacterium]